MGPEMQNGFARWPAERKSWTLGTLDDFAQRMALVPFKLVCRSTTDLWSNTGISVCKANSFGTLTSFFLKYDANIVEASDRLCSKMIWTLSLVLNNLCFIFNKAFSHLYHICIFTLHIEGGHSCVLQVDTAWTSCLWQQILCYCPKSSYITTDKRSNIVYMRSAFLLLLLWGKHTRGPVASYQPKFFSLLD